MSNVNNVKTGVYTRNGEDFNFNFYTSLNAYDKMKFVNEVTSLVVGDNYNYVIRDLMFDFSIVNNFTDVDLSSVSDSNNSIREIENIIEETNIVEIVKANVEVGVIEELEKAVDLSIEYKTGIHRNPIAESIGKLIDTLENKMSGINTDALLQAADVFNNMSGEFTMDKLIDSYGKSDMFKKHYDNMMADRERRMEDAKTVIKEANKNATKMAAKK